MKEEFQDLILSFAASDSITMEHFYCNSSLCFCVIGRYNSNSHFDFQDIMNKIKIAFTLKHDCTRKFFMLMNIPAETRRGEQLGVELALFNFHDERIEVGNFSPLTCYKKRTNVIVSDIRIFFV